MMIVASSSGSRAQACDTGQSDPAHVVMAVWRMQCASLYLWDAVVEFCLWLAGTCELQTATVEHRKASLASYGGDYGAPKGG